MRSRIATKQAPARCMRLLAIPCALIAFALPNVARADDFDRVQAENDIQSLKAQVGELLDQQQQLLAQIKQLQQIAQKKIDTLNGTTGNSHPSGPPVPTDTPRDPIAVGTTASPGVISPATVSVSGLPRIGVPTATIGMVEYIDFDSGATGEYERGAFRLINEKYIKTGKIQYFSQDLIGPKHPDAMFYAQTAHCAAAQGKYWQMRDSIFTDQTLTGNAAAVQRAHAIGADVGLFEKCLVAGKFAPQIGAALANDKQLGMTNAPVFFIGKLDGKGTMRVDKVIKGSDVYDPFANALDDEIAFNK